jgi:hypothetical protein
MQPRQAACAPPDRAGRSDIDDRGEGANVCFAPEADAAVGVFVVAVGIDTLRHVDEPKQIPLAALPLLFGLHQLSEAFVWWGLQRHVAHDMERIAVWIYVLFALVALPAYLPLAVGLVERSATRRRVIAAFGVLGVGVAASLAVSVFRGTISAVINGRHVDYAVDAVGHGGPLTTLYVIATCGALLASSYRDIAVIGALNLVVTPLLMVLTVGGFVSLWCFWAALVSVLIDVHFRRQRAGRASTTTAVSSGR